jgi:hypothetical protein
VLTYKARPFRYIPPSDRLVEGDSSLEHGVKVVARPHIPACNIGIKVSILIEHIHKYRHFRDIPAANVLVEIVCILEHLMLQIKRRR